MIVKFVRRQIEQIRVGGLSELVRKVRLLPLQPRYLLLRLWRSRFYRWCVCCVYRLSVVLNPDWMAGYLRLGDLFLNLNRVEEAIVCWQKAISLQPDSADILIKLAKSLIRLHHFEEAFAYWQQAFLLKPDTPDNYNGIISDLLRSSGQVFMGQAVMQAVVDAHNDHAKAHQLDRLKFRFLAEWPAAIGHIALLDNYVKMGLLGRRSADYPILLVHPYVANPCYLNYWRRYLPDMISDPVAIELLSSLARHLEDRMAAVMTASGRTIVDLTNGIVDVQAQWETERRDHLLTLTESDSERGWRVLQSLGVPPGAWFVGLHVRERRVRSLGARDADISTYRMAIESIVARGGWVIRMGDSSMTPLPPMPYVIDYVHSEVHSDWMDVFLWAKCRFFIGTTSGPAYVPPTFGIPCVVTNWFSLIFRWYFGQDIFIPKLVWSEVKKRHLTFAEVLSLKLNTTESLDYLSSSGVRLVDNTPEEINDVSLEMLGRLEGTFRYTEEDEQLQGWFNKQMALMGCRGTARIGRAFLRKYAHLFEADGNMVRVEA